MAGIAADRDLLFGLLALQNGLVEQDVLILAFRAWTRDKSRPIAEILAAQGAIDTDDRALLERLAVKHLRRHGDDPERSLAALSPGRSIQAGFAKICDPDIEATLGHVGLSEGSTRHDDDPDRTGSYSVGRATSDGQRFRVLRPHARGGLGSVFVALDSELDREVALKQILEDRADDATSRSRFLIEAQITGSLEHPGIVPVYGLGTYGDGRPYYAMRFIRGDSLKEAIDLYHALSPLRTERGSAKGMTHMAKPQRAGSSASAGSRDLALRKLLRRFVDVCNTIEYAHSRGVLHRDIKPANIILGKHGETLVVDWGLAKPTGRVEPGTDSDERLLRPSSASGSADTLPGSALGTPAYMSPEQAEGKLEHLGPRSDVYSLGATLYYILTGSPPFAGDVADVIHAVLRSEFRQPRQLDPGIDPALEAICLQAMAYRPEDRYRSCRALAEDIERWMADEPVTAWSEPFTRRAQRWGRLNRTLVSSLAASGLVALVGMASVLAVQARANVGLKQSNDALVDANTRVRTTNAELLAANQRERERFNLAMDAVGLFHGNVSEDLLLKQRPFAELRAKLLRGAAAFYDKLAVLVKEQSDKESRAALGRAYD
jgi:serine/threonine-protein kinase